MQKATGLITVSWVKGQWRVKVTVRAAQACRGQSIELDWIPAGSDSEDVEDLLERTGISGG